MSLAGRLNKYWRVFATCFCFFLFALGGLLLGFIVFPLLVLFAKNKAKRELKVQSVIQKSFFFVL